MKHPRMLSILIPVLVVVSLVIDLPKLPIKFSLGRIKIDTKVGGYKINLFGGKFVRDLEIKKGLDLAGGIHVLLQADMSSISKNDRSDAIKAAKEVIERRVNLFGVTEPNIQTSKAGEDYRLIVELPGVRRTREATKLIGQTADLRFKELKDNSFSDTDLSGRDLKKSFVSFNRENNAPQVNLEFTKEGAEKFARITKRNLQKPLAIFLDKDLITAPVVQSVIKDGKAVITGKFTLDEAKNLSILLNAGALPVPLKVIEQRNIGPTLGEESVSRSLRAGILGLFLVAIFMVACYGNLGFLAVIALLIYGLITLALYKLIPVVLTLPGLTGFILSIGMAVDSNILIFERIREELRMGKPLGLAMELGFGRAWDSIRDANIATLTTCFILFNPFSWGFLVTSGPIRGFALTLALGVAISLFTGIVVTRNLIRLFYKG